MKNESFSISSSKVAPWKPWLIVMSASLLFLYSFMQLNLLNSIDGSLMRDFSLNATQLGTLSSMYFYANFFLVFPAALLIDRFSVKKLVLFAMTMAIISMFGFAASTNVYVAGFYRFLSGVGGAFCFVSCVRLASQWFEPKRMALATGCLAAMCMIGGMMAQSPMVFLSQHWGWRHAMMAYGVLGIFFILIIMTFTKDFPAQTPAASTNSNHVPFWKNVKMALLNHYNWLCALYFSLMNLPVFLLGALWGSLYLSQVNHVSHTQASYITSMMFVGLLIGSPLIGWLSDHISLRRFPMIIAPLLALLITLGIIYMPNLHANILMILFLLLGLAISAQTLSYPTVIELNPLAVTATANSILSTTLMVSGFVFQPLFGWLLTLHWDHTLVNNVAVYSAKDFKFAMMILPIAFIVSLMIAFSIKETHCQSQAQQS